MHEAPEASAEAAGVSAGRAGEAPTSVPFGEAVRVWARMGLSSFGGPAGQIALMQRELVERRRWIDEPRFLHALDECMLLPGPEAQQLATYVGWFLHGYRGGLVAGVLFVLPGFASILALSMAYAAFQAFASLRETSLPVGARLLVPVWSTVDLQALLLAVGASAAIFRFRLGALPVLGGGVAAGMLMRGVLGV